MEMARIKVFALVFLVIKKQGPVSSSFSLGPSTLRGHVKRIALYNSKLFGPEEEDDGAALAKKFYEQLKQREEGGITPRNESSIDNRPPSASSPSMVNAELLPPDRKKFTGKPETMAPGKNGSDSSFFTANNAYDQQQRKSPREQMMEREFQLVERAEKGLAYQAVLAVAVAILYLYVGLTGGIQSGSDFDLGNDENIADEILMPVPKDTEASYWL
jgi:hypothetical protein